MTRRPRIGMVYDVVFPFTRGGAERRYHELGTALTGRGWEVHLYGMKWWDGPDTLSLNGMIVHGICPPRSLYTASGRRSIAEALWFGFAAHTLIREDLDIIDCSGFPYFSIFSAKLAALVRRTPVVVTWHEVWGKEHWRHYLGRAGLVGALVEQVASRLPDANVAASAATGDRLKDLLAPRSPVSVIENGIDVAAIDRAEPAEQLFDILFVGRLVEHKNVSLLLNAFREMLREDSSLTLGLAGDGPDRDRLEGLARALGVAGNVTFLGFVEDAASIYGLMKSARCFALPSYREGFGIVAVEANACALPVVTIDSPDNAARDLIDGQNGLVTAPSATSFAAGLRKVLDDPAPFARAARASSLRYDWTAKAADYDDFLRGALAAHGLAAARRPAPLQSALGAIRRSVSRWGVSGRRREEARRSVSARSIAVTQAFVRPRQDSNLRPTD